MHSGMEKELWDGPAEEAICHEALYESYVYFKKCIPSGVK